jgi:signal peptidase I
MISMGHLISFARVFLASMCLLVALRGSLETVRVEGVSMLPTYSSDQLLLVNKVRYWQTDGSPFDGLLPTRTQGDVHFLFGGPAYGDVVVLRPPAVSGIRGPIIKRVIGLPGDVVSVERDQVLVNGEPLAEPYTHVPPEYTYPGDGLAVVVPEDSYFVLGDNRPISDDSHLGWVVPASNLVGQVVSRPQ